MSPNPKACFLNCRERGGGWRMKVYIPVPASAAPGATLFGGMSPAAQVAQRAWLGVKFQGPSTRPSLTLGHRHSLPLRIRTWIEHALQGGGGRGEEEMAARLSC